MPRRLVFAALLACLLALPASASGAVNLGQTYQDTASQDCGANTTVVQVADTDPGYEVETPGVITELRTEDQAADGGRLHVFRPRGNDQVTILASLPFEPKDGIIRIPAQVRVQPGDVLGLSAKADSTVRCGIPGTGASDILGFYNGATDDTGDFTLGGAQAGRANVAATLEPDADGDGFGDETQDRCADDATRTTQDCAADVFVSQSLAEPDMERDDVNVITIAVRNNGTSIARDVRVVESLPPGVQLVATSPSTGGCAGGAPVDCTFPAILPGATGTVLVVIRTVATGEKTLTATASSPTPDPNGVNNAAELRFDVAARRTLVAPGTFCRVPRLTGLSRTAARSALEAAGCRLGRTSRKRYRSGRFSRVKVQSIPAGTRVETRTRVNITLRRR